MGRLSLLLILGWIFTCMHSANSVAQQISPRPVEPVGKTNQYLIKTHLIQLNRSEVARAGSFAILDDKKVDRTKIICLPKDAESQLHALLKAKEVKIIANPLLVTVTGRPVCFNTEDRVVADADGKLEVELTGRVVAIRVTELENENDVEVTVLTGAGPGEGEVDDESKREKEYKDKVTLGQTFMIADAFVLDAAQKRDAKSDELVLLSIERVK